MKCLRKSKRVRRHRTRKSKRVRRRHRTRKIMRGGFMSDDAQNKFIETIKTISRAEAIKAIETKASDYFYDSVYSGSVDYTWPIKELIASLTKKFEDAQPEPVPLQKVDVKLLGQPRYFNKN